MLIAPSIWGCTIPVFQYALERWPADLYEVILFHGGPLNSEEQDLLKKLRYDSAANIYISKFDVSEGSDQEMLKLWESQSSSELPWIVLLYPRHLQISEPIWSARFTASAVEMLLHSPVRTRAANRILEGDVAAWILLDSGVKEQNEAIAHLLDSQLSRMEEILEILEPEDYTDYVDDATDADPKVAFSLIRVARADPKEQILIRTLLHSDPELRTISEPIAFPIFGRGRALCALVGDDVNERNIEEVCAFLVGWCSCQVKELNPGMDILMSADWDGVMAQQMAGYTEEPWLEETTEAATINTKNSGTLRRNILLVALIQLVIVIIATCVVVLKRKRRAP